MKDVTRGRVQKLTVSAMCMALGLVLPFLTGQIPEIGNMLLPMHLPIFLCGILCGAPYGAAVGALTPLLRSLLFSRPVLYPGALSMSFELCAYGALVGLFLFIFKKKTPLTLYASLIFSMLGGRVVWALARVILLSLDDVPFSFAIFLTEGFVQAALGILIQLVLIPALVMALDPAYRAKKQPTVAKNSVKDAATVLSRLVLEKKETCARVSVAIDGRAAAGKTTLAKALGEMLSATVVHTDDYLLPFSQRTDDRMAKVGGHFDYERFQNEILTPWQKGEGIVYRLFECKSGEVLDGVALQNGDVLIVEGAYSLHPSLAFDYTLTVFCDVTADEQRKRILSRNGEGARRFFETWIPKEEAYIAAFGVDTKTDLTVRLG